MKKENDQALENATKQKRFSYPLLSLSHKQRRCIYNTFLPILLVFISIIIVRSGMMYIKDSYQTAEQNTYNSIYQTAFDSAETRNHVSNYAIISVEGIQEVSRLEVLTVSDSKFVIKNADENDKTISWLEVQGTGVYTVDLSVSEFMVDSERGYVLARIPKPVLAECKVSDTGKQFWKDASNIFNGSAADGVHLAQSQMSEGKLILEDAMRQNRRFNEESKKAAVNMVESLVRQLNPNIPDLQVEVEFIEDN